MTATAPLVAVDAEQRMILDSVSWGTYERLLADYLGRRVPRFSYDRGWLEIMTTSREHVMRNVALASVVEVVAEELGVDVWNLGQSTHKREDIAQGFEPDTCFFFHNRPRIRSTIEFDPAVDLPPDLVVEVDISSSSLNRFPIYAGFGVPEVWRDHAGRVTIWRLEPGTYVVSEVSGFLPILTGDIIARFVEENLTMVPREWRRSVRDWVHQQMAGEQSG
jgi:Uma2 family endonuclease